MILLDTSVLSHVFRRRPTGTEPEVVSRFRGLVAERRPLAIPGIVYQEILSGVRDDTHVKRLISALKGFPIVLAGREDHLEASRLMNDLRRQGVTAASIDALIAAMAIRHKAVLFTLDRDFEPFARLEGLELLGVDW